MACGDVLSLEDLQTAKKHQIFEAEVITGKAGGVAGGATIGTATNPVTGQTQQTLPSILADLGFDVQSWTSSTGGVLASANQVFLNDTSGSLGLGDYYAWGGPFPKTVPAGTDPALVGSGYVMRSRRFAGTQAREALRRSYAEVGCNLVDGSFEAGGTLVNANDVLLQERTGKAFSGPAGTVAAGTNPSSGGFVDVSKSVYGFAYLADISAGLYGIGARLRVKDLGDSLWAIVIGGVVDGVTVRDAGSGKTAVLQYEAGMDLESFGVSETATPAQNFAGLAAAIKSNIPFTSKNKTYVIGTGSIDAPVKTINWVASGTEIKLDAGNKPSALFVLRDGWSYYLSGMTWNGNRLNVSGNHAGFFVVSRTANFIAENTKFKDLRRYGYNVIGDNPYNTNVKIINLQCDDIGVLSAANGGPVGEVGALGEAVKCEHVRNFTLDGFEVKNSSGTGDGQVQKAFYCINVTLKNFNLESVGPSQIYPAISNVRNRNVSYENINIVGASQVCIEDNSNLSVTYKNILTYGRKAMISGSDGAEFGARHSQNVTIENWDDTSTESLAFNIVAVQGLTVRGLSTNQNINISRDDPSTDRRSRDISLSDVTCTNLSTLLTQGYLELNDCDILGVWTNTHVGTAVDNNSVIASYTDSAQADTALVRITPSTNAINVVAALDPGASVTFKMPKGVATNPFAGKVSAINAFTSSPATQWSQIDWSFYDFGTPTVNKAVVMSGSTPRQNTALSVLASNKTLTFTNNDSVQVLLVARVELIDRNAYKG